MTKVGNLDVNIGGYFELFFITTYVDNLHTNIGDYFELSFVMADAWVI